jgi:hypothetical protein
MRKLYPLENEGMKLVRMGPKGDGGYLVPDDLDGIEACFSPGVSSISGFEKDCAELGMKVFMADRSVERPAESHEAFHFIKKHVGAMTSNDFMTIDDWVNSCFPKKGSELLLQIDIEGAEYETFLGMSAALMQRFRVIVAEFHKLDELWNRPYFSLASRVFEKIMQSHACVHMHPNNCYEFVRKHDLEIPRIAEFTFLRRDRLRNPTLATSFPHPLDCDNTKKPHLPLPKCWHG